MPRLKQITVAGAICLSLLCTSCLGSNRLFEGLRDWNDEATSSKWGNEAIFLGLNIVLVYPIALWGDYLIFNSIEFWSGKNTLSVPRSRRGFEEE